MEIILAALLLIAEPKPDGQGVVRCTTLPEGIELCIEDTEGEVETPKPTRSQCGRVKGIWMCEA